MAFSENTCKLLLPIGSTFNYGGFSLRTPGETHFKETTWCYQYNKPAELFQLSHNTIINKLAEKPGSLSLSDCYDEVDNKIIFSPQPKNYNLEQK